MVPERRARRPCLERRKRLCSSSRSERSLPGRRARAAKSRPARQRDSGLAHIKRQQRNDTRCGSLPQSGRDGPIQQKTPLAVQHLCFPEAHGREMTATAFGQPVQGAPAGDGEALAPQQPPDPDRGVERNLHRRASTAWASSTESSGSIANTLDPLYSSQGRWLGEVLPFSQRNGQFQPQ